MFVTNINPFNGKYKGNVIIDGNISTLIGSGITTEIIIANILKVDGILDVKDIFVKKGSLIIPIPLNNTDTSNSPNIGELSWDFVNSKGYVWTGSIWKKFVLLDF